MKVYLTQQCYKWLVQLKILKPYIISHQSLNHVILQQHESFPTSPKAKKIQICYDDQLYLQNGYLIGVLLKQILKQHKLYSQKLLKIRKITVLKKQENWEIVYEVLEFMEYPFDEFNAGENVNGTTEREYDVMQIQNILQFLYDQYGPFATGRKKRNLPSLHLDPERLQPYYEKNRNNSYLDGVEAYSYHHCTNLLEYTCFVIHKAFNYTLSINQCLGLLIQKGKYLKILIKNGINLNKQNSGPQSQQYAKRWKVIQNMYTQIMNSIQKFQSLLSNEKEHFQHFMQIFAYGTLSNSLIIAKMACLLIQSTQNQEWFKTHGFKTLIKSDHPDVLHFIIEKSKKYLKQIFNVNLHQNFLYEEDLLNFLTKFIPVLSKSRYCKQVLQNLPLSYFVQKSIQPFQADNIDSSESKIRILSRQVSTIIFRQFFKKLPQIQRSKASISFQTNGFYNLNMSLYETLALLANLFQIIKIFLLNEDSMVQKYFKIAIRYLKAKEFDIKEFVLENLKELYFKMMKSFPLGCFLITYQEKVLKIQQNPISQSTDFQFLLQISKDQSLIEDEVIKALNTSLNYFMQINGDQFLQIILNLLKFKQSLEWSGSINQQILSKWTQIKLPNLAPNTYKRKSPQQLCRFEAFGIKRREILKFQQYQKYKLLLQAFCTVKDSDFLKGYWQKVNKKVQQINRNRDLTQYNIFLKKLLDRIKLNKQLLPEPLELASKSLIYMTQGLNRNDTITKELEMLNQRNSEEEDEIDNRAKSRMRPSQMEQQNFKKLRDQVTQSPIHGKTKDKSQRANNFISIKQKMGESTGLQDQLNQFLMTKNKNKRNKGKKLYRPDDQNTIQQKQQENNQSNLKLHSQLNKKPQAKSLQQLVQPFTETQQPKPDKKQLAYTIIMPQQMEQHEITYLKIQKENYSQLIDYCKWIYKDCLVERESADKNAKSNSNSKKPLEEFLKLIKMTKYLPFNQAEIIWNQCHQLITNCSFRENEQIQHENASKLSKKLKKSTNEPIQQTIPQRQWLQDWISQVQAPNKDTQSKIQDLVWQLVVQYAFLMFGFKRNTRVRIKLVEVFTKLLMNYLSEQLKVYKRLTNGENNAQDSNEKPTKSPRKPPVPQKQKQKAVMKRQMQFQNKLIFNKLLKWNKNYSLSLQVKLPQQNRQQQNKKKQKFANQVIENLSQNNLGAQLLDNSSRRDRAKGNPLQAWLVCFEVVNDLLMNGNKFNFQMFKNSQNQSKQQQSKNNNSSPQKQAKQPIKLPIVKALNIGLIQPISRITSTFIQPTKINNQLEQQINDLNKKPKTKQKLEQQQQKQLAMLQKMLEEQQIQSMNNQKLSRSNISSNPKKVITSKINTNLAKKQPEKVREKQLKTEFVSQKAGQKLIKKEVKLQSKLAPPRLEYTNTGKNLQSVTVNFQQTSKPATKDGPSFSKLTTSQLRDKIKQRKSQVQKQIKQKKDNKTQTQNPKTNQQQQGNQFAQL